ncbi:hypothetical protein Y032_0196g1537 [Ancylostoma ceylanicum]|uniref:Glutathione peroxidase n=1 Tax=Ancylostoma ceylanicum TaxID=53326 RepID=A0A016SPJ5_9BILA|nr:hypothetical protein Y032_0196g1537 [Ancylostoma ceylanicum]
MRTSDQIRNWHPANSNTLSHFKQQTGVRRKNERSNRSIAVDPGDSGQIRAEMLLWLIFCTISAATAYDNSHDEDDAMSAHRTIYDFTVKDIDGKEVSLSKYKGQVVIVVNVASYCGFTNNHYTELKTLQQKYYDQGLRVAAFPCNQFGAQEPSCEADIKKFVKETFRYEPDMYSKVDVNGDNADPFWTFLKTEQGGTLIDAIKWNFTKFLVNRKGYVVKRYAPTTSPLGMTAEIERLLAESP